MVAVPTPFDAVAGDKLTAVNLDAGVRDPLLFLMTNYPRVHAWDSSGAVMTNGTATLVPLNSETYDTDNMHDAAGFNSRVTYTTAGLYDIDYLFTLPAAAYTQLDLNIRLNAGGSSAGGSSIRSQPFSDGVRGPQTVAFRFTRYMNAGEYLEAFITQSSGANRALSTTSLGTRCFARWIATS